MNINTSFVLSRLQLFTFLFECKLSIQDNVRIYMSAMSISLPNPMFYNLLESSHRDDSNKWSNLGLGQEIMQVESIDVNFTHVIWSSRM